MKARHRVVIALVFLLSSGSAGHAAANAGSVTGEATGVAASIWEATRRGAGGLWTASTSLFATPDPFEYLPAQMPNRDRRFMATMEAVGYRLVAIDTREGLFGRVRYRFEQQRALSPNDSERILRGLAEHRSHHSGAVASAERRVLRGLLMVGAATDFQVSAVNVDLLPWPQVSFHVTRRDPFVRPAP